MNKVNNKASMPWRRRWLRNVIFVGAAYLAIGVLFGTLGRRFVGAHHQEVGAHHQEQDTTSTGI